jgi:hypothetical protein
MVGVLLDQKATTTVQVSQTGRTGPTEKSMYRRTAQFLCN